MEVTITRQNAGLHFLADNGENHTVSIDAKPEVGGGGKGMRPMQILLVAVGSCSVFDAVLILEKKKQVVKDVIVKVKGERDTSKAPSPFTAIHIHFELHGKIEEHHAKRSVELAVEKYCSVKESLDPAIKVTHSFEIIEA